MVAKKTSNLALTSSVADFLVNDGANTRRASFEQVATLMRGAITPTPGTIDVASYGATTSLAQTTTARRTALQTAIYAAAVAGLTLTFGVGVWLISGQLLGATHSHLKGAGGRLTQIKLDDNAAANENVLLFQGVTDFSIEDLAVHGNVERLATATGSASYGGGSFAAGQRVTVSVPLTGVTPADTELTAIADGLPDGIVLQKVAATGSVTVTILNTSEARIECPSITIRVGRYNYAVSTNVNGCGFGIANAQRGVLARVMGQHCAKHCLDIAALTYGAGLGTGLSAYPNYPSRLITVMDSFFEGGGDDNVTTHGSELLMFQRVHSQSSNGTLVSDNSNGIEIDDESRYVVVNDCTFLNVNNPVEIKGHNVEAAANHVFINNLIAAYCYGFDIHHTGHGATPNPASPTGGQIIINGMFLRQMWGQYFRCLAYRDVFIRGLILEDDGTCTFSKPLAIENGVGNVVLTDFATRGFTNLIDTGLFIQDGNSEKVTVRNGYLTGGALRGIYVGSAVDNVALDNITIVAPVVADAGRVTAGAQAIYSFSGVVSGGFSITNCRQTGYAVELQRGSLITPLRDTLGRAQAFVGDVFMGPASEDISLSSLLEEGVSYINGQAFSISRSAGTSLFLRRTTDDGAVAIFRRDNVTVGNISVTGTGTSYATTSDQRLKTDKGLLSPDDALAILNLVKIHSYEWNMFSGAMGTKDIGAFAQELFDIYPQAVIVGSGKPGDADYIPWAVDLGKLMPQMIVAFQDFDRRLNLIEEHMKGALNA